MWPGCGSWKSIWNIEAVLIEKISRHLYVQEKGLKLTCRSSFFFQKGNPRDVKRRICTLLILFCNVLLSCCVVSLSLSHTSRVLMDTQILYSVFLYWPVDSFVVHFGVFSVYCWRVCVKGKEKETEEKCCIQFSRLYN